MSALLAGWLAFIVTSATPGPSTLAIAALAMGEGRGKALRFAAGVVVASQVWGVLALAGFAAVMEAYAGLALVLKIVCALYLALLAVRAFKRAQADAAIGPPPTMRHPFRSALVLHLSNPKAILGWLAIVVIGVPSGDPALAVPFLAGCGVLAIAINGGYALAFSHAPVRAFYVRGRRALERGVAALFAVFACGLLASAVRR